MANTVTLTFAGETKDLESSFGRVGGSAKKMGDSVKESAGGFDKAGEAADNLDTKAMGFRDTLTGVQDTAAGTSQIMKGDLFGGMLTLGAGLGDLGSGFYNTLIPAMKSSVTWLQSTKVGTLAAAAAQKIAAVGAKVWAGTQWLLNAALTANPIGLVIAAIVALVALFVIAWKHSATFRAIVIGTWNGIKAAALAVARWFTGTLWPWIKGVGDRIAAMFQRLPGRIKSAFSGIFSIITWPFRTAFNFIADAWNNTIGRLSWSVPSWVPGIGGRGISVPNLPHFHAGGVVPGVVGTPTVALLQAGERIGSVGSAASDGGGWVVVRGDAIVDALTRLIADRVAARGGRPAQLGIKVA